MRRRDEDRAHRPAPMCGCRHGVSLGPEAAALTHGHPSGYLSAGMVAAIIRVLLDGGSLAAKPGTPSDSGAIDRCRESSRPTPAMRGNAEGGGWEAGGAHQRPEGPRRGRRDVGRRMGGRGSSGHRVVCRLVGGVLRRSNQNRHKPQRRQRQHRSHRRPIMGSGEWLGWHASRLDIERRRADPAATRCAATDFGPVTRNPC